MEESAVKVASIFIYPIKSCHGISVPQAPITSTGFRWDRHWQVINSNGRMLTQRVDPKLALVEVELPEEAFCDEWEPNENSYLVVKAPGMMNVLMVPLGRSGSKVDGVSVWEWTGHALDEGDEAAQWFSTYLDKPCRLVRFDTASACRDTDPKYAPGYTTMFADMLPFLLASKGSVDAINSALKETISINRFRMNIVVDGCEPFEEDLWKEITIGKYKFYGVKLCNRCKVPTVNQETGTVGCEELSQFLKTHRSDHVLQPNGKAQGKVYFGQYVIVSKDFMDGGKGKVIQVGDPIYVIHKLSSTDDATL